MDRDDTQGYGPETYSLSSGLDSEEAIGEYTAFVHLWGDGGFSPVSWSLTATLGGDVLWEEEGVFEDEARSANFTVVVESYVDPGCEMGAALFADADQPSKLSTGEYDW